MDTVMDIISGLATDDQKYLLISYALWEGLRSDFPQVAFGVTDGRRFPYTRQGIH
jgi:hypothetical protein